MGVILISGAAVTYAGENVLKGIPEDNWVTWISGATAVINNMVRNNWNNDFAGLSDDVKHILTETGGRMVANDAIKHQMGGYTSRFEAETMLDVNRDGITRNISVLRDKKTETFIKKA